jgi:hypothetical protein
MSQLPSLPVPDSRLVHIGYNPRSILPLGLHPAIENYLNLCAIDWYRYAAQNYVLLTNLSCKDVTAGLLKIPGFRDIYFLVTEMEGDVWGCMPKEFWDWIEKYRQTLDL